MDPNVPLTAIEPQPMSNPSSSYPMAPAPGPKSPPSNPEFGLKMGPENRIPDDPGSMVDIPRPPLQTFSPETIPTAVDIRSLRTNCSYGLRDYMSLQQTGVGFDASTSQVDLQAQVRTQAARVLGDLRTLQSEVRHVAKMAENHRWRRWLIGGAVWVPFLCLSQPVLFADLNTARRSFLWFAGSSGVGQTRTQRCPPTTPSMHFGNPKASSHVLEMVSLGVEA